TASLECKTQQNTVRWVPVPLEYGYTGKFASGMDVNNKGLDVLLGADISRRKLGWHSSLNLNLNRNTLQALPNGLDEIIIDNRKMKVGQSGDRFWTPGNQEIYEDDNEIAVDPA